MRAAIRRGGVYRRAAARSKFRSAGRDPVGGDRGAGLEEQYPFEISDGEAWQIDMRPAIESIVRDVLAGRPASYIAALFHNTVAAIVVEVCRRLRAAEGLDRVCLSGGTFQKSLLAGTRRGGPSIQRF